MGAIQNDNNSIFLNVSLGKIRRQLKEPTEGSVPRINKNQKEVHELVYDGWVGRIDKIETRKTDYGTEVQLVVDDGDQVAKIGMMYTSDHFLDFANRLLNFTAEEIASEQIEIVPFSKTDSKDGKTYTNNFLLLKLQNEAGNRQRKYTKDNPGDMPNWEQVDNPNGEGQVWSQKKQRKFLIDKIAELMLEVEQIRQSMPPPATKQESDFLGDERQRQIDRNEGTPAYQEHEETVNADEEEDDLPF